MHPLGQLRIVVTSGSTVTPIMSHYTAPPPSYKTDTNSKPIYSRGDESREPLLGSPRAAAGPSSGAIFDQPDEGDLPDDFKARIIITLICD